MFKIFPKAGSLFLTVVVTLSFLGCGDVEKVGAPRSQEFAAIEAVLKAWRTGYETEDVDAYIDVFWADGFRYVSDMGTPDDATDDVIFDDIRDERDSAIRVFNLYQEIEIELEEPPEVELNAERNRAEVRAHYRIQGFVADGESLEGGYTGWYAEGDNLFIFELRDGEWRIKEWIDEAYSEEQIEAAR